MHVRSRRPALIQDNVLPKDGGGSGPTFNIEPFFFRRPRAKAWPILCTFEDLEIHSEYSVRTSQICYRETLRGCTVGNRALGLGGKNWNE